MTIKGILKAGMIMLVLGFALNITGIARASDAREDLMDDFEEYNGSIGPDNALYGLKLEFENIDESFTWNASEKLEKKVSHSGLRIAEAKTELINKNNDAAQKAFEYYKEKIKETEESISKISGNDSGILNAQKNLEKHQYELEQLIGSNPNNTGLQNAYNKSLELKDKFEQKTEIKIERIQTSEGKNILREIKKEKKDGRNGNKEIGDDRKNNTGENRTGEITQKKRENETENKENRRDNRTGEITQENHENKSEIKDDRGYNKSEEITQENRENETEIKADRGDNNSGQILQEEHELKNETKADKKKKD